MGCNTCGSNAKINKADKNGIIGNDTMTSEQKKQLYFDTKFGKFIYYSLTVLICISPIINIIGLYFFWKAIYGNKGGKVEKNVNEKLDDKINKDKDNA